MRRAFLSFLLAFALTADAAGKRAFTIEDFYRLETVGSPAISPDGQWIAYTVARSDLRTSKKTTNLWRVGVDGRNASPLTHSDSTNDSPAFSPDGKTLAFVSHRSGEPQIWFLPVGGGEPEKKTSFPGGVGSFVFSPDGKSIAFAADVYPECGADADCNKRIDDAREKAKLKVHVADTLLYRHWTDWRDGKRTHVLLQDLSSGSVRDLTPGDFESPVFSLGGTHYAFSADGRELLVTSNRDADQASSTNADLWAIPLEGEPKATNLTARNSAWDGQPLAVPGTASFLYRFQTTPRYESDRFRLGLLDRKTGEVRSLTEPFDYNVNDYAVSQDGRKVWFLAEVKGRTPLHELDVAAGRIRELSAVGTVDAFDVAPDGRFAVVARRRIGSPLELYRVALDGSGAETRLTTHNKAVEDEVDIRPAEEQWVEGADGKKMQVWIVKPHGFDPSRKYPVILNIHGGPQQQWSDAFRGDWQVYPGAGYVVAFPNPHGSTGFGQAFTAAISGDWSGKVMTDLQKVTQWLKAQSWADASRLGAMGWSWGGYAVMWIEGHNEAFGFKALASMMGVYDLRSMHGATEELWFPEWDLKGTPWENPQLYRRDSPSEYVKSYRTPCLVVTGEKDYRVPYTQSLQFFTDLQKMKVPSRLVVFPNAGHWPAWYEMALYYNAHLEWFHRWLGGGPAPWDTVQMGRGLAFEEKGKDGK